MARRTVGQMKNSGSLVFGPFAPGDVLAEVHVTFSGTASSFDVELCASRDTDAFGGDSFFLAGRVKLAPSVGVDLVSFVLPIWHRFIASQLFIRIDASLAGEMIIGLAVRPAFVYTPKSSAKSVVPTSDIKG